MRLNPRSTSFAALVIAGALSACAISPNPLTDRQLDTIATGSLARVAQEQEAVGGSISLHEAMARAIKYNLDAKVELMQRALRTSELSLAHYNLLPNDVVSSGYAARDKYHSAGELNLITMRETGPRTTTQERKVLTSDLTFSWSILDFGLSYIRARQSADRVLIAEEARRKVVQRIIEDVRTAYWRALSAQRMTQKLAELEARTRKALANARWLQQKGDTSPITALTYERELVEIQRTAQELQRELSVAKTQLAALMNVPPETHFALSGGELDTKPPVLDDDAQQMVEVALNNRAEIRDVSYQKRINKHEAHAALLELLPGIQMYGGQNYDSNKYLMHDRWVTWGAKSSWNVVRLFQYPARRNVVDSQDKLLDARTLALTMAIMTQVHVSRIRYQHVVKELATAREYFSVQLRLVRQMRVEAKAERISEQTLIREEMNTLVAEARRDIAFAAVQNAFANLHASVGIDPYADGIDLTLGVKELEAKLRDYWLERGDFGGHGKIKIAAR